MSAVNKALGMHSSFDQGEDNIKSNLRIFKRGVVIHTLNDPSLRNLDDKEIKTLRNPDDYFYAPRNSIICRIITDGEGKSDKSDHVCYPFFSSHLMMPIKAGEQVWIFNEQPGVRSEKLYWICRIPESIHVEDVNFTHGERRWGSKVDQNNSNNKIDDGTGNFTDSRILTFQNGPNLVPRLAPLGGEDSKIFNNIIKNSKENKLFSFEPVPRLTKRPGDLVIQGSNNSSITLGTLSGWDFQERPTKDNTKNSAAIGSSILGKSSLQQEKQGSVDIVVGRGRIFKDSKSAVGNPKERNGLSENNSTRPLVVENELGFEVDKNVATQQNNQEVNKSTGNLKTNPQEGDPDLILDASRVLLASNAKIDLMFKSGPEGVASNFGSATQNLEGAAVAIKSDHIRLIARKVGGGSKDAEPSDALASNGSIRIIKEGSKNDDLASVSLESNGEIQISGNKIYLGRTTADSGKTSGQENPYIRYKELESLWKDTMAAISEFCTTLNTHACPIIGPSPQINLAASTLKSKIEAKLKNQVTTVKSERIFGE